MILQWSTSFDPGHFAWYSFCTLALLVTFVPGTMSLCAAASRQPSPWRQFSHWLPILSGCGLAWITLIFSLAFAPAPMELPASAPVPLDLRELMANSVDPENEVDEVGRGGWIGGMDFAGLKVLEPEGDPEEPGFPSRRPAHQLPLASFLAYQTSVYLAVVGGLGVLVRPYLSWPRVFVFLLFWSGMVYAPLAHWVWGDGWLALRGAVDPGGGLLPLTMGIAAAAVSCVSRRRHEATGLPQQVAASVSNENAERTSSGPLICGVLLLCLSHLILVASFSVYVHQIALLAMGFLNVLLAGTAGCIAWSLIDAARGRSQQSEGSALGLMAGCAAAAGSAGVITPQSSLFLGFVAGAAGYACVVRTDSDSHTGTGRILLGSLAVPAALGLVMPGILGVSSVAMQRLDKTVVTSLVDGDLSQLTNQVYTVAASATLVFAGTALLLTLLQHLPRRAEVSADVVAAPVEERLETDALRGENRATVE